MEKSVLINFDDIKSYTSVSGSIDIYKVNPHILNAQILYLEPTLGSELYDRVIDLFESGDINLNNYAKYKTLLYDYITPSLVFHTMELFIPFNSFQLNDGGTFQHNANNSTTSTQSDIEKTSSRYKIIGIKYDSKMIKYLELNKNDFPEFIENNGLIKKNKSTFNMGINLSMKNVKNHIRR